jgi:hypothetical protein
MNRQSGAGAFACQLLLATALLAQQLPFEPAHDSGQSLTGAFEGWFQNPDGSYSILVGYYNRNLKQEIDIPVGAANHIEPGGPDAGQPTHFLPGRQWGVFTIQVPKDFGDRRLTWTLTANGKTTTIPLDVNTLWEVEPFREASGNAPPWLAFSEAGPFLQGPAGPRTALSITLPEPVALTVWTADDAKAPIAGAKPRTPAVTLGWSKFRGPGAVTFADEHPAIEQADCKAPAGTAFSGRATTTAKFSEPGEYILRVVANDWSGDGGRGFQCCWSNAQVKVTVKPQPAH